VQTKEQDKKASNAAKNAKKRARKKRKAAADAASKNELRQMAFSKPVSAKVIQNAHELRHPAPAPAATPQELINSEPVSNGHNEPIESTAVESTEPIESWDEWKNRDEQYVLDQFQRDMEAALRISQADIELHKNNKLSSSTSKKREKKKMQRENSKTMSLHEFTESVQAPEPSFVQATEEPPDEEEMIPTINTGPLLVNGHCPEDLNPQYYDEPDPVEQVHEEETVEHTETITPQKKKKKKKIKVNGESVFELDMLDEKKSNLLIEHSGLDSASIAAWNAEMEKKDRMIEKLKEIAQAFKDELSQVKKRNKQLCFILGQGEMKDKADILLQIEELTSVKDELSSELTEMHSALEQERSKVSALKLELTKYQTGRSKSKSISEEK